MYAVDKDNIVEKGPRMLPISSLEDYGYLIIATTDPSLGLPLLPVVEEDVEELAKKAQHDFTWGKSKAFDLGFSYSGMMSNGYLHGWKDGYKATSAKKYTEEDLRKAFLAGESVEFWRQKGGKEYPSIERYIQSLNPKPIQVEIETEEVELPCPDGIEGCEVLHLEERPVIENGYVKVIRWGYPE